MTTKKPFYKKKWFIAVAALLVLGFIGSIFGLGDDETATETTAEPKTEETGRIEKTAEDKAEYEEKVLAEYLNRLQRYDNLVERHQYALTMFDQGADSQTTYDTLTGIAEDWRTLEMSYSEIKPLESYTKEDKDLHSKTMSSTANACAAMKRAAESIAKAIDKNDLSPSKVSAMEDEFILASNNLDEGLLALTTLNSAYGVEASVESIA